MTLRTRRHLIRSLGILLPASLAGCLDLNGEDSGNSSDSDGGQVRDATGSVAVPNEAFVPQDGDADDEFGWSVDLDGDRALVGAIHDEDPNGNRAGSAYVFGHDAGTWAQRSKLVPDDGDPWDRFGNAVAIDAGTAVVGAYNDEDPNGDGAGSAYVFERRDGTWTQSAKLVPDDGSSSSRFGQSVDVDGNFVLVGASIEDDPNGEYAGAAYVFELSDGDWIERAKLVPADGAPDDAFGGSVAIDNGVAIVGASEDDHSGKDGAGAAYTFERGDDGWSERAKLTVDEAPGDRFGSAVGVAGDTAVVGAVTAENADGSTVGAAYVFERTEVQWVRRATLTPDGHSGTRFGGTVSLTDDLALVGDHSSDTGGNAVTGRAYLFSRSANWGQDEWMELPAGPTLDMFGDAVAVSDTHALVGAPLRDTPAGEEAGVVGAYEVESLR